MIITGAGNSFHNVLSFTGSGATVLKIGYQFFHPSDLSERSGLLTANCRNLTYQFWSRFTRDIRTILGCFVVEL